MWLAASPMSVPEIQAPGGPQGFVAQRRWQFWPEFSPDLKGKVKGEKKASFHLVALQRAGPAATQNQLCVVLTLYGVCFQVKQYLNWTGKGTENWKSRKQLVLPLVQSYAALRKIFLFLGLSFPLFGLTQTPEILLQLHIQEGSLSTSLREGQEFGGSSPAVL